RQPGLSTGLLSLGHVLPVAGVHVLAGADLAAVPRPAVQHAPRGSHHQVSARATEHERRHDAGLRGAVRRRDDLAPVAEGLISFTLLETGVKDGRTQPARFPAD